MKPQEELIRAERAKQILGDKLVREALDSIRSGLIENWRSTPLKDADLREKIWAIYVGACKFEEFLYEFIETGKLAQHTLDHAERQQPGTGKSPFP
jgi:Holliday junction resolvasome RuvABC ATP-dependent DNA helicase subunit